MKELLNFLNRLENANIHYSIDHHREEYLMVKVDIPGERWEVEFSSNNEILIEIFKNSDGVHSDETLLENIFATDDE